MHQAKLNAFNRQKLFTEQDLLGARLRAYKD